VSRNRLRALLALLIAVTIPGVPLAYASRHQTTWRHFHVVVDGQLYRSGQLPPEALDRVIRERRVRTVVCLRSLAREGDAVLENAEELWCSARGLRYVRLNPAPWGSPAAEANVRTFLRTVRDPDAGPILVHCFAGLHRTGVYCAIYRMQVQGWNTDDAIAEMCQLGYVQADAEAMRYLRAYVPGRHAAMANGPKRDGS
jgi:tyrosine-protein phosphatase SIW14